MAAFHHASHFRRLSKIILLTKQLLLWRWPPQFKSMNVSKTGRQLNYERHQNSTSSIKISSHQILVTYRISNYQLLSRSKLFLQKPTTKFRPRFKLTAVETWIVTFGDDSLTTIPKIVSLGAWQSDHAPDNDQQNNADHAEHDEQGIKDSIAILCF